MTSRFLWTWPWPQGVKKITGPVSLFGFRDIRGKTVCLFGDTHFSYANQCTVDLMDNQAIVSIHDLLISALTDPSTLVLAEFLYSPRKLPGRWGWYHDRIDTALKHNATVSTQLRTVFHRVLGIPAPVVGGLSKAWISLDSAPGVTGIDIRSEPNVCAWEACMNFATSPDRVGEELVASTPLIPRWIRAFLLEDDIATFSQTLYKGSLVSRYFSRIAYRNGRHEMRSAYVRLSDHDKAVVMRFAKERIALLMDDVYKGASANDVDLAIKTTQATIMDIYTACIIASKLSDPDGPRTLIMYAGHFHTKNCSRFLEMMWAKPATLRRDIRSSQLTGTVSRCVRLRR